MSSGPVLQNQELVEEFPSDPIDTVAIQGSDESCVLGVSTSLLGQSWIYRTNSDRMIMGLAQRHSLSEPLARILTGRRVDADGVEAFLSPRLKDHLPDPGILRDMERGVGCLADAIINDKKIAVFGDYDVDGGTSSALLSKYFEAIGHSIQSYIPDRQSEGYGPNVAAFEKLAAQGAQVIVTVDCGTHSFEPIDRAGELSVDVVVVDHHIPGEQLPEAAAVINPNRHDDLSDCGNLAAVGVTFMLLVALNRHLREASWFDQQGVTEPNLMQFLDLVALGTVCDVVPLTGLNRVFVKQGLNVLRRRQNIGLVALCEVAQLSKEPGVYELGFLLGPRINAGGRIGESNLGLRLLTSKTKESAWPIAVELDRLNAERRELEAHMLHEAMAQAEQLIAADSSVPVLVLSSADWHPGIIGIVSSRVKDRFHRPSILIGLDDQGQGKGSGRSISGVDLGAAVLGAKDKGLLISGGGHAMAAGLTIDADKISEFHQFLCDDLAEDVRKRSKRELKIDAVISASGATLDLLEEFAQAGPFGAGNPEPLIAIPNIEVSYSDVVGEDHIRCTLRDPVTRKTVNAIAFRAANNALGQALQAQDGRIHTVGRLRKDDWRGGRNIQFTIEDAALA